MPLLLFRKILAPLKTKSALPPPKRRNFMDMGFSCRKSAFLQAPIKLAQPSPAPEFRKPPNVGAGACGIWEHREETQRALHETMRLAEAWLVRHAPGGSMPSQTLKHCKIQGRRDAPKMAILEAPCAQNPLGGSTMRLPEALLP